MPDVLTKEQVAVAKNAVLEGRWPAKELMELSDSHEALRARVEELERKRDEERNKAMKAEEERDYWQHQTIEAEAGERLADQKAAEQSGKAVSVVAGLQAQLAAAEIDRDRAIAHDRQPYPTADAYARVCIALENHKAQLAVAREASDALEKEIEDWDANDIRKENVMLRSAQNAFRDAIIAAVAGVEIIALRKRVAELERERDEAHGTLCWVAWNVNGAMPPPIDAPMKVAQDAAIAEHTRISAQLAVARAFLNTYDNEDACAGDRIDAANRLRAALDGLASGGDAPDEEGT